MYSELDLLDLPNTYPDYIAQKRQDCPYNYNYEELHFKTVFDTDNKNVYLQNP